MKKKIIIFTSSGGGGHESASRALDGYLKDDYELVHTYIFSEVLHPTDPLHRVTFGKLNGEWLYNKLILKKYFRTLNLLSRFGICLFSASKNSVRSLIRNYLTQQKPDIIISIIPYVNDEILRVAQELAIPFILIPTDLDGTNFVFNVDTYTHKDFWIVSSFNDPAIQEIIATSQVPKTQLLIGGFPVRKSFFEAKDTNAIKKQHGIPEDKPVLFILMGAAGSNVMCNFVEALDTISFPLHLILVLGRNSQLRPKIEKLIAKSNFLTATLFNVTDQIADLMAVADLCITKSGSVSVCETIYSNLPLLLDATSAVLKWELFNHEFVKRHGFGESIKSYADIVPLVEKFLKDTHKYAQMKMALMDFEKKNLESTLRQLLSDILG